MELNVKLKKKQLSDIKIERLFTLITLVSLIINNSSIMQRDQSPTSHS